MTAPKTHSDDTIESGSRGDVPVYLVMEDARRDYEPSLAGLLRSLLRGWWIIAAATAISIVAAVALIKTLEPKYEATMILSPASQYDRQGLASSTSRLSSLAAITGIRMPADEFVSNFSRCLEIMTSVKLANQLIDKYDLAKELFASQWDAEEGKWVPPSGLLTSAKSVVRRYFGLPEWSPPDGRTIADYLKTVVKVSPINDTGLRKVTFTHSDPELAVQIFEWMHREADTMIRNDTLERSTTYIAYIKSKLQTETFAEHRDSLISLLAQQERTMMMLTVDLPFCARIEDGPFVSEKPVSPRPILILSLAGSGGGFLGIFLVFLVNSLRRSSARDT